MIKLDELYQETFGAAEAERAARGSALYQTNLVPFSDTWREGGSRTDFNVARTGGLGVLCR